MPHSASPATRKASSLSEAVGWVRERLEALVSAAESGTPSESGKRASTKQTSPSRPNIPAMELLAARLRLSAFDKDVLLLCAAAALDARIGRLCAAANADGKPNPSFALAMRLFDDPVWEALGPQDALRRWRLIEIHQTTAEPLILAALRADERIVNFLMGLNHLDDRVANWVKPVATPERALLPPSHAALCERIESFLAAEFEQRRAPGRPVARAPCYGERPDRFSGLPCGRPFTLASSSCIDFGIRPGA